ncbi:MAG TPA: hypothetical protein VKB57_25990 [Acidimicrobiales bacterium]|nr:hypothetical protein [Acidimicrobiales bacterium]
MGVTMIERPFAVASRPAEVVRVRRRSIDKVLVGMGVIAALVFAVAGGLLMWGSNFATDYVHDELTSQKVFFPAAAELKDEGRTDLVHYAGQQVTTGSQAQAYAGFINGHLQQIGDGKTYSQIDDRGAAQAVEDAKADGASKAEVAKLQSTADELRAQRDTLFKGETLRGLLLTSYAWATIGRIAAIAAWAVFAGAAVMAGLVVAGLFHLRITPKTT